VKTYRRRERGREAFGVETFAREKVGTIEEVEEASHTTTHMLLNLPL